MRKPLKIKTKNRSPHSSHAGWQVVDGRRIYFRSSWEHLYALYLDWLKEQRIILQWEYEPKTFWFEEIKRGVRSYKPDFRVLRPDGSHFWVEVKGYMDQRSKTKLKRFKRYFPAEKIMVIDKVWFLRHSIKIPAYEK